MRLQVLLSLIFLLSATPSGITAPPSDEVNYENQVIASIGSDQAIADASQYLLNKHATLMNYNYEAKWDTGSNSFVFQGDDTDNVGNINWAETKIQVVGHGSVADNTVGGLTPRELAEKVYSMSNNQVAKKISIVSCTRGIGDGIVGDTEPAYLTEFMNEAKNLGMTVSEVSIRASLVAVNRRGEKLTGIGKLDPTGQPRPYGIEWTSNDRGLKWIGSIEEGSQNVQVRKVQATDGADNIETRLMGIIPKNKVIHMADKEDATTSYKITDDDTFTMIDEVAKNVYNNGDQNQRSSSSEVQVSLYDSDSQSFNSERVTLREFRQGEFINELRHQGKKWTSQSSGQEYFRFGDLVVRMDLKDLYVQVVGMVESTPHLAELQQKFSDFPKKYEDMKPKTGPSFFDDVKKWMKGQNSDINITPENFEERVYNAKTGAAMFLSESIRCFQNHFTNMMVLDMVDAHLMNKELYFGTNINPMARGGTWLGQAAVGAGLLDVYRQSSHGSSMRRQYRGIKEKLVRITKSWLSHVSTDTVNGVRDNPPQANVRDLGGFKDKVTDLIESIGKSEPDARDQLRDYAEITE